MPKLRHYDDLGTARFVTFSCYHRHQYLCDAFSRQAVLDQLTIMRERLSIKIFGYVIMPDHVHLVLHPPDNIRLGLVIGQAKARSAKALLTRLQCANKPDSKILVRSDGGPAVWQRRCYDHNCRSKETVIEKLKYCHENPVKQGIVNRPEDWIWSSYNWYNDRCEGIFEIDGYEV